ncbi:P-loop containing nucleoside triphosphate hydrolase protein [Amylocarpus encephaloides]|uniref:P-loop containing nucleoside triphosphate hydrolase protein n=1 Tax=Amylocarpus encephaloides TaxID=45428 RepID=A0A9P7YCX3_9HELO|nr:P-loop containing nucleoside triphosphate hydrolase protein [Amylocarpus encephaloides]
MADQILVEHVAKRWKADNYHASEAWRNLPEIPGKEEISPAIDPTAPTAPEEWNDYQNDPEYPLPLPKNIIHGPWEDTSVADTVVSARSNYLGTHYQILREDAIRPLRDVVFAIKHQPNMGETSNTGIYTHVTIRGIQLSPIGAAFRVEFSTDRSGKRIRWDQSKRLMQGSLVALSTTNDNFQSICKILVVAARPVIGLEQNPPQVDLFWGDNKDMSFDPAQEYIMVEARSSYFEASRHMLEAIQKLMNERFSLENHIVGVDPMVDAPNYIQQHSTLDLSSLVHTTGDVATKEEMAAQEALLNVDVLQDFPPIPQSKMDSSQTKALESMLTKKVAIIQGPPGTGKTFVSVSALRVMLSNLQPSDPPIIVSAQTNHALDQLLNHVMKFEPNIVRLGGRCSKENTEILERTIYQLRLNTKGAPSYHRGIKTANAVVASRIEEIKQLLAPIVNEDVVSLGTLFDRGIITQVQRDSLGADDWEGEKSSKQGLESWLPPDQLEYIPRTPLMNSNLELEEGDIETEQLKELEDEVGAQAREEADRECLSGQWVQFMRTKNGRDTGIPDKNIKALLHKNGYLHGIPAARRGDVYRYWVRKLDAMVRRELRILLDKYARDVNDLRLAKWSANIKFMSHLGIKLIGCTTTGLSKYRGLLAALCPRTLLIEEAAETLEGTVIAGMLDSLQQLILVGDHQQLQASCSVKALEVEPFYMNVSMFERLVNNSIGYVMLNRQRRMIPEIRGLLCVEPRPFYTNLLDDKSVLDRKFNRPPIPGMGGRDLYFFHHNWPEARNSDLSKYNQAEAEMIVGHFRYLTINGVDPSKITILTFYNGQRKVILRELKRMHGLEHIPYFNCFTVDSYQGEENDVILLSLVRSNTQSLIGFLENRNRLVVALSRARRGLYLFGNALTLTSEEATVDSFGRDPLWAPLLWYMRTIARLDIVNGLPITCQNHHRTMQIFEPDDWVSVEGGGCTARCGGVLDCGHSCTWSCHVVSHSMIVCKQPCTRPLVCGHGCSTICGEECFCSQCEPVLQAVQAIALTEPEALPSLSDMGTAYFPARRDDEASKARWNLFSSEESDRKSSSTSCASTSGQESSICTSVIKDAWISIEVGGGRREKTARSRRNTLTHRKERRLHSSTDFPSLPSLDERTTEQDLYTASPPRRIKNSALTIERKMFLDTLSHPPQFIPPESSYKEKASSIAGSTPPYPSSLSSFETRRKGRSTSSNNSSLIDAEIPILPVAHLIPLTPISPFLISSASPGFNPAGQAPAASAKPDDDLIDLNEPGQKVTNFDIFGVMCLKSSSLI